MSARAIVGNSATVCVCCDDGRQVFRLRNKFLRNLKSQCKVGSVGRQALGDGYIVLEVTWQRDAVEVSSPWAAYAMTDEVAGASEFQGVSGSLWLHIGHMSFCPYQPVFQVLEKLPNEPNSPYTWVKATNTYKHEFELYPCLHRSLKWSMKFFTTVDTWQTLGRFAPSVIPVKPLPQSEECHLWPLRGGGGRKRRAPNDSEDGEAEERGAAEAQPIEDGGFDGEALEGSDIDEGDVAGAPEVGDEEGESAEDLANLLGSMDQREEAMQEVFADIDEGSVGVAPVAKAPVAEAPSQPQAASSSAAGGPPQQRAPLAPVVVQAPGMRTQAIAAMEFGNGRISYYRKGDFVAICQRHGCILTRTSRPGRRAAQGRPLGLMAAWLQTDFETKEEHLDKGNFPSYDARLLARTALALSPEGMELASHEGPGADGDLGEPEGLA